MPSLSESSPEYSDDEEVSSDDYFTTPLISLEDSDDDETSFHHNFTMMLLLAESDDEILSDDNSEMQCPIANHAIDTQVIQQGKKKISEKFTIFYILLWAFLDIFGFFNKCLVVDNYPQHTSNLPKLCITSSPL